MLVSFNSAERACEAVSAVFCEGITPSALEFIERDAVEWTLKYTDLDIRIEKQVAAFLLIEADGDSMEELYNDCERITKVMQEFHSGEILVADNDSQKNKLWKLRRSISDSVKFNSVYKEEDTVVPRAELPKLLSGVKSIGNKYGFQSVCYGHAGDGNLHVNIIKGNMSEEDWNIKLKKGIREIFHLTKNLGGTISGEHGIGLVQKEYMDIVFTKKEIDVQKKIKNIFDPNLILNPGKIFI